MTGPPRVRLHGAFPRATREAVEPLLPQALTLIEQLAGRPLTFPSPVLPMTKEEIAEGRSIRGPGHEGGAGHGLWVPSQRVVKVNATMPPVAVLANVVHEYLHMALPDLDEVEIDQSTEVVLRGLGYPLSGSRQPNPKRVGGNLYAHRSDLQVGRRPEVRRAASRLPSEAAWDVVKTNGRAVTFSRVPRFNEDSEPAIAEQWRVDRGGRVRHMRPGDNPPVLHRRELMVPEGYGGFDVERARRRTASYDGLVDSSRIGRRRGWDRERRRIGLAENPVTTGPLGSLLRGEDPRLNGDRVVTLNMGMGRDSMAMLGLLLEGELEIPGWGLLGVEDIDAAVFSDTGCEWPHTYELLPEVRKASEEAGLRFVVLEKGSKYHTQPAIIEELMRKSTCVSLGKADCTDKHKIAPIKKFVAEVALERFGVGSKNLVKPKKRKDGSRPGPYLVDPSLPPDALVPSNASWTALVKRGERPPHLALVGIVKGEERRIQKAGIVGTPEEQVIGPWVPGWVEARQAQGRPLFITETYPLFYAGISKDDEQLILERWGWGHVRKSGCYICVWQPISWFWALRESDPERWEATVEYERRSLARNAKIYATPEGVRVSKALPEVVDAWRQLHPDATVDSVLDKTYSRVKRERESLAPSPEAQQALCDPEAVQEILYEFEEVPGGAQARLFNGRQPQAGGGTAISREFPAPAGDIMLAEKIRTDTALDVGSGLTAWGPARYDPYHPDDSTALEYDYDVVTCIYVLNVIPGTKERREVTELAASHLLPDGRAYFAVRTDNPCEGEPQKKTSKGYQVCKTAPAWKKELKRTFDQVDEWAAGSGYVTFRCE
jgi:hypothetical protein